MSLEKEEWERIKRALDENAGSFRCPICKKDEFSLADGYFNTTLQKGTKSVSLGGTTIPAVVVTCMACGYIMQFSAGVLGLLTKE